MDVTMPRGGDFLVVKSEDKSWEWGTPPSSSLHILAPDTPSGTYKELWQLPKKNITQPESKLDDELTTVAGTAEKGVLFLGRDNSMVLLQERNLTIKQIEDPAKEIKAVAAKTTDGESGDKKVLIAYATQKALLSAITVFDPFTGERDTLKLNDKWITSIAPTPTGENFVIGTDNGLVFLYGPNSKQEDVFITKGWVRRLAVSPDGTLLALVYDKGRYQICSTSLHK
jgi:WD40 repeat protein